MSNTIINISLKTKSEPVVNITTVDSGTVLGSALIAPSINFIATGPAGTPGVAGQSGNDGADGNDGSSLIPNNAVTTDLIANNAVTNNKIASLAIGTSNIIDQAVSTIKIKNLNVTASKIANNTITATQIANNTIGANQLADLSIPTGKLANLSVTSGKIEASITSAITANTAKPDFTVANSGTINSANIVSGTPTSGHVLKWNGSSWVAAAFDAVFTFSINSWSSPSVVRTNLIGSGQWIASTTWTATYNNGPSGNFSLVPTANGAGQNVNLNSTGTTAVFTAKNYPSSLSSVSGKTYKTFRLDATHDGTDSSSSFTCAFRNNKFFGPQAAESLTSTQISSLSNTSFLDDVNNNFTNDKFTQSEISITCTNQYVYYCYPSRISGTPVFKIEGFPTSFQSLTNINVTNSEGFEEEYKVFKSPQTTPDVGYNGTLTFQVL